MPNNDVAVIVFAHLGSWYECVLLKGTLMVLLINSIVT